MEMGEQYGLLSSTTRMVDEISTIATQMSYASTSAATPPVRRAQEGLQYLRRMLPWVRAVLTDAEEREILDESVCIWLRELRGVAYDADDALDEFEYHLLRADAGARAGAGSGTQGSTAWPRGRHLLHASFGNAPPIIDALLWHRLDFKVEIIKRRFEEIGEGRKALRLAMEDGEGRRLGAARASARTPSSCFIATPCLCGREWEKEVINGFYFLLSEQCLARKLSVIPIVGMGGVGKTTLVQHIYNDLAVSKHFEMKGWVCVSHDFDLVALTRRILEALVKKPRELNGFSTLQEALARAVEGKKFLLVLDDMWNEKYESWELLQVPLLSCAEGSAIVMTTRSERAAAITQTAPALRLRCLSDLECWKIFQQQAFGGRDPSCHQDLVEIGWKIVRKCKGLPLAVKALGGLLRFKPDVESWEDILHSDFWDLDGQGDEVISVLRLSYLHLKTNLRQCFVYCSIFPKAYRFTKSQLVYMWVAQGFIRHGNSRLVEDIGSEYFEELLQRSFFQYSQGEQLSRYLEECEETHVVMHDLIHDLAQSISMGECSRKECMEARSVPVAGARHFSLAQSTSRRVQSIIVHAKTLSPPITEAHHSDLARECFRIEYGELQSLPTMGARHLSLVGSITSCNTVAAGNLRTFLILKVLFLLPSQSRLLNNMIPCLHCVRVLDFSRLPICELPDAFGNLIHLRYLNLSYTQIRKLPKSICMLYHMQTLLLTGCERLQGLPHGMKNLTNLRTLPVFHVGRYGEGCSGVEELKGLVNLRGGLTIYRLSHVLNVNDAKMADLRNKASLRELRLSWASVSAAPVSDQTEVFENLEPPKSLRVLETYEYGGRRFPSWMGSTTLNKLVKLKLYCCSNCVVLPQLGQLPYLKHLHIGFASSIEGMGSEFRGDAGVGFPSLEVLLLEHMYRWERWHAVERGDFPRLSHLEIRHCYKLKGALPIFYPLPMLKRLVLQHCVNLDSVLLYNMPSLESRDIDHCPRLKFLVTPELL